MQFQIALLLLLAAIALTSALPYGYEGYEDDGHAHYQFEYGVHDPHTHDIKSQYEHKDGGHLIGGYTLQEPDGTQRVVKYRSGPHSGFEAVVERIGYAQHPAVYGHERYSHGGVGATSYVGVTHWNNQGPKSHEY